MRMSLQDSKEESDNELRCAISKVKAIANMKDEYE